LAKQLSAAEERESFLVNRKRAEPTATALLNELSVRVPQHTWLVQFGLRGREVELSGFSPRASTLIAEIEASDMLAEVQFAAPVLKDEGFGLEKFRLSSIVTAREGD
jgi:Tfp pilus assembly protein PilN